MREITPERLGVPLMFEGEYEFDRASLIPQLEALTDNPKFSNYGNMLEIGDAGSTAHDYVNQPHLLMPEFTKWALERASEIYYLWKMQTTKAHVVRSWVNRHRKGGWTNLHTHPNTDLVVAAYIQVPKNGGNLLIIDPLENHWFGMPTTRNISEQAGKPYPTMNDKVYFLAPFIRHGTQESNSDRDRWVLSMNINCERLF
jgi:hypothetical protein